MSENKKTEAIEITAPEKTETIETAAAPQSETKLTVEMIFAKLTEIQTETAYLNETISKLSAMHDGDSGTAGAPGNILGAAKAKTFGDIVRCREATNQQLLKFYEKMYDDMMHSKAMDCLDKIGQLQEKLTDAVNSQASLSTDIVEALRSIADIGGEQDVSEVVSAITGPIAMREENYRLLIQLYEKLLRDEMAQKK